MPDHIPTQLDPTRLCQSNAKLVGSVEVDKLKRLLEIQNIKPQSVDVELDFFVDATTKKRALSLAIDAKIETTCQRCMDSVVVPLLAKARVIIGVDENLEVPESFELVTMVDDKLALIELIEDELIIALPLVPKHEGSARCEINTAFGEVEVDVDAENSKNPFAALSKLKKH